MGCWQHQAGIQQLHEEMATFLAVPGKVQGNSHWGELGPVPSIAEKICHSQEDAAFWLTMSGHVLPLQLGIWGWRVDGFLPPHLGAVFRRRWRILCRIKGEWSTVPTLVKVQWPHHTLSKW